MAFFIWFWQVNCALTIDKKLQDTSQNLTTINCLLLLFVSYFLAFNWLFPCYTICHKYFGCLWCSEFYSDVNTVIITALNSMQVVKFAYGKSEIYNIHLPVSIMAEIKGPCEAAHWWMFPCVFGSQRVFVRNLSLIGMKNEPVGRSHMNGFTFRLVLTHRQKATRKWLIRWM